MGFCYSHSWAGRNQQDAPRSPNFASTAAVTPARTRATQSKRDITNKCLLDGKDASLKVLYDPGAHKNVYSSG